MRVQSTGGQDDLYGVRVENVSKHALVIKMVDATVRGDQTVQERWMLQSEGAVVSDEDDDNEHFFEIGWEAFTTDYPEAGYEFHVRPRGAKQADPEIWMFYPSANFADCVQEFVDHSVELVGKAAMRDEKTAASRVEEQLRQLSYRAHDEKTAASSSSAAEITVSSSSSSAAQSSASSSRAAHAASSSSSSPASSHKSKRATAVNAGLPMLQLEETMGRQQVDLPRLPTPAGSALKKAQSEAALFPVARDQARRFAELGVTPMTSKMKIGGAHVLWKVGDNSLAGLGVTPMPSKMKIGSGAHVRWKVGDHCGGLDHLRIPGASRIDSVQWRADVF